MGGSSRWHWNRNDLPDLKKKDRKKEEEKPSEDEKEKPSEDEKELASIYQDLRVATMRLEELIDRSTTLSAKDLHRLDKSVVVQKAGYKMVKRILKAKGFKELKRTAFQNHHNQDNLHTDTIN